MRLCDGWYELNKRQDAILRRLKAVHPRSIRCDELIDCSKPAHVRDLKELGKRRNLIRPIWCDDDGKARMILTREGLRCFESWHEVQKARQS